MTPAYFDPDEVLQRLDWAECDDLEFKSAKGGLPRSMWETYSAMANTHGGVVLLGVENDGRPTGVPDAAKLQGDIWNTLNNRGKVSINLLRPGNVQSVEKDGVTLLALQVPRAERNQRPVFIGQNPLTGTYRRDYEGDYHCTEQEVGRMLSDRSETPADSRILEHFGMDDLDTASVQQYRNRFASFKPTHVWLGEDDRGLLTKLGGWRRDRATGVEGLTVAGLLMFGKEEALREALPQYHVDYREKLSDDPAVRWTDRLHMDGSWAGNLFQFYLQVFQRLSAELKVPFQLDADLFRKGETSVHEAIREVLMNALIHADYQGQGGVLVERYRSRFEFSNPGTLLVSMDQLLAGNVSECRNKALQNMFTMFGAAEEAGSGVDKIRRGWQSQHWRSPRITEQLQPDRVMWMLPMVSLIPEESLTRLRRYFGAAFDAFSEQEVLALVAADIETRVDNQRLRQVSGGHSADVTELLRSLVARQILVKKGRGRWSWYHLPDSNGDSVHKAEHSHADSVHKRSDQGFDSVHKEPAHSVHKPEQSAHSPLANITGTGIDPAQWRELANIAAPARQHQRLAPRAMEELILSLCQQAWLTRRQLAELLHRNPDGLRSRYLTSMVEHKLLQLRYPDKPNRTDQAYRAADSVNATTNS